MQDLRWLLAFVRPYRRLAALALLILASLVAMDLAIPRLIQRIIDEGIAKNDRELVTHTARVMLGISALSTVLAVANNVFSVRVGEGVARDLREALFLKIQSYSFADLDQQKTGQLLVRLTSDVSAVKALTQISLRIGTRAPLLMLGSLTLMITTSGRLALTLLPLLAVTSGLIAWFVLRMEPLFQRVQEKLDGVNNVLQENIAGARLVKSLVRGDTESARFEQANEEMTERSIGALQWMSLMTPALTLCINLGMVAVIWVGGLQSIRGELTLGEIVAFTNYLLTTMSPLIMMTMLSKTWAAGLASLRRLDEIFATVPKISQASGARALPSLAAADVSFDDVSFTYGGERSEPVLRDIVLAAEPGKTLGILGSTGAGKSTLVNLIPRFYDVSAGSVQVAGSDVRELTRDSLMAHIGLVPQEAVLFSGTVRDNIRYGRPSASEEDVLAAARAAQAHEFIVRLPEGYDSRIEQRGRNLSGGQKQRLSLARALLMQPQILILDDSTSAVDLETESKIQQALASTRAGRTTFLVAQRISSVLDADTIVVLEKGRVVAQGSHSQLLASSDVYREIYASQLGAAPAAQDSNGRGAGGRMP